MTTAYLRTRLEERAQLAELTTNLLNTVGEAAREITEDEQRLLDGWETRASALDEEIPRLETMERGISNFQSTLGRMSLENERQERRSVQQRETPQRQLETRSYGQRFVESEQFRDYEGHGSSQGIDFEGFIETRAAIPGAITTDDWSDTLAQPQRIEFTNPLPPTPFLDAIGHESVGLGAVEYVRWDMRGPEAGGPIPETDLKPKAKIEPPKIVPVSIGTYAHWVPISRQSLEDLPRIRSIVETQLRNGLRRKLQSVALAAFAAATIPAADGIGLNGIRQAVGTLESYGIPAPSLVLNPDDYANLDIEAAAAANTGPVQFGRIWGLTAVPAPIPAGTCYVGSLRDAVTWFDRNQYRVLMSDSHEDFFVRNALVLLAEARAEFEVTHPEALLAVPLGTASPDVPDPDADTEVLTGSKSTSSRSK